MGSGISSGRVVAGEAEHHPRVTRTADVNALRDVGRLLVDAGDDATRFGVETVLRARIPDLTHRLPDDPRDVDVAVGGDLADHDHETGRDDRLARHSRQRILGQDRVEDGV